MTRARIPPPDAPTTALLLSGGGARAAWQVGVLQAVAEIRRACGLERAGNPFPIMVGTSAGAINAAALASGCDHFGLAVRRLARIWGHLRTHHVYRADAMGVLRSGAHWLTLLSLGWMLARFWRLRPNSLLDNRPLGQLLERSLMPLERLAQLVDAGHLRALAVSASSYSSGEHVTFCHTHGDLRAWVRMQRRAVSSEITHAHLLASAAIPFAFPAVPLPLDGRIEYFGDGSMRQSAPLAPAIHLGAERILVVGAARRAEPYVPCDAASGHPPLAHIAAHALSSIFLDSLALDVERAERINQTLALIAPSGRARSRLRPVQLLVISPSQRIETLAARHLAHLPRPVRALLAALGVQGQDARSAELASYLLFECSFTRELMALGRADAMAQRDDIVRFMGWQEGGLPPPGLQP